MNDIRTFDLPHGLTLICEPISSVASAALSWLLPVGAATDSDDADGYAAMLAELIFRGAGDLSSREHSDALDRVGVQRTSRTLTYHLRLSATVLGRRLPEALPLVTSMVRAPRLPSEAVEPVRSLCLQALDALDDDPQHLVMLRLAEQHVPAPFGRSGYGDRAVLAGVERAALVDAWRERAVPGGSILALAGDVDPDEAARQVEALLAGWEGARPEPEERAAPPRAYRHIEQDTAQVHIGLAYDAPPERHPDAMLERLATNVLSGSTSGRLFTEVRQKRSLCYSVGAGYRAGRDRGLVTMYAGTTPQRAQETLDVAAGEISRLFGGAVTPDEFERAVIGLKSSLVMQGESTPARAAALGSDHFRLGRARSLAEIARAVDAISRDDLNAYLARRQPGPYTVVSVGPEPLTPPTPAALTANPS